MVAAASFGFSLLKLAGQAGASRFDALPFLSMCPESALDGGDAEDVLSMMIPSGIS
jgi:hypothetical protein